MAEMKSSQEALQAVNTELKAKIHELQQQLLAKDDLLSEQLTKFRDVVSQSSKAA